MASPLMRVDDDHDDFGGGGDDDDEEVQGAGGKAEAQTEEGALELVSCIYLHILSQTQIQHL